MLISKWEVKPNINSFEKEKCSNAILTASFQRRKDLKLDVNLSWLTWTWNDLELKYPAS